MSWSKIKSNEKKPLKWWFHKILCEFGWIIRNQDSWSSYYYHLNKCLKEGFNIYGEKIK